MHGYAGKILTIDLSKSEIKKQETDKKLCQEYLGGNGFGTKLLYDLAVPKIDAYDERNPIIITPGLLNCTAIPTGGKTVFHSKSPLTNTFSDSVMGSFGYELKYAGYDALIIKGKAKVPSYISIENDNVQIKNAEHLWNKTTRETAEIIKKDKNDYHLVVATIGIAGENLVRFASIDCEERNAGRGGIGAVMGSKKLKAISVKGTKEITVANPKKLLELIAYWNKVMFESGAFVEDTKYGTGEFMDWINAERGAFPTRNWQESIFKEREKINPYYWCPKYVLKNKACYQCTKSCGKLFVVKDGKYKGTEIDGVEYELQYSLGSECGISNPEELAKANELVDLYGMDGISCGVVVGFAMECYEKGLISKDDLGFELKFGDAEGQQKLIELIAKRQGIGNILAEGTKIASQKIKGSEDFAIHVKGMEPPAYDVRALKGLGLGFMTSHRGACHLKSGAYAPELVGKFWRLENVNRFSTEGKGQNIKLMEDFMAIYDTLGVCKFSRKYFFMKGYEDILEAVLGVKWTEEQLLKLGEKLNNIKKLFNLREGLGKKDDKLPKRILTEPIKEGVSKGHFISEEEQEKMLSDYYKVRGWDENGVPRKEKLEELGLV